jgi:hypothetical protein
MQLGLIGLGCASGEGTWTIAANQETPAERGSGA